MTRYTLSPVNGMTSKVTASGFLTLLGKKTCQSRFSVLIPFLIALVASVVVNSITTNPFEEE
ncbi:hypothetical protein STH8232_1800 [Streptococcus thermophilus JIM 8232]|nr:hypothetical protein STH8232_1800 [Streptococcus thermophilus JIM 8232]